MTNISIEKKTLATATLISGVAGLNSANRCKPIVCRNTNSRTLNMKRPKTLLLVWLLTLFTPAAAWAQPALAASSNRYVTSTRSGTGTRSVTIGSFAFSQYENTDGAATVWLAGSPWRVLSYEQNGNTVLAESGRAALLYDGIRRETDFSEGSNSFVPGVNIFMIRDNCDCYDGSYLLVALLDWFDDEFADTEKSAIIARTLLGGGGSYYTGGFQQIQNGVYDPNRILDIMDMENQFLWPLSCAEAQAMDAGIRAYHDGNWWLRTPGERQSSSMFLHGHTMQVQFVESSGMIDLFGNPVFSIPIAGVDNQCGIRPAFYLDLSSVLLVSSADDAAPEIGVMTEVGPVSGNTWKLTLKDAERSGFSASVEEISEDAWVIRYEGAKTGANETLSALVLDGEGNVIRYVRLAAIESESDTLTFDPVEIPQGGALYVFNEQNNGSYTTSYSSELIELTFDANAQNIAAGNITQETADITWEGLCDSYALRYREILGKEPVLNEGFEGGTMPQGWTIEGASQDPAKTWRVGVGDYYTSTGTHSGNYNALITHNTSNQVTYLVMPAFDLGGYGSAELSFWYVNRIWSGDIDEFAVCYRIGNEGEWNELWNTTENHQAWTSQTVALTGLADGYQIGFRFTDHYGYGVGLDDIALNGVVLSEWITVSEAESPYTLTGLTPETTYEVQVQGTYGSSTLDWSETVTFTTLEACPVPFDVAASDIAPTEVAISWTGYSDSYNLSYRRVPSTEPETILNEGFEGGTMPQGWIIEGASQDPAKTWRVGVGDHFSETGTHSGNYNALITHNARNQVTYLVMPAFDLGEYGSAELSFWYINKRWGNDTDEFAVCYRIGSNGGWNELWSTTENHQAWTSQTVALTGLADGYQIGFRFTDHYGYGVGLDDIALSGVFSNPSWITLSEAESPQAIASLRPETAYEVKVQGICDGIPTEWSQPIAFSTPACTVPGNLAVSDITATGATLTWTGTSVDYNVQLGVIAGSIAIVDEDFSEAIPASWDNDSNYPWAIVDGHMQSSNGSIHSTSSAISLTMTFPVGGTIEFDAECKGEGEGSSMIYDKCIFTIDGEQQFCYGANMPGWNHFGYTVDAGTHTFTWSYTKDGSVNPTGDYFAVDNVVVAVGECNWEEPLLADGESITLSALTPSTTYYAQVQGICNNTLTDWSEIVSFTTLEQTTATQTIELVSGWNWVSFNVETTLDDLKAALVEALPGTAISIKSQTQNTSYNPNNHRWVGSLAWDVSKMYMIKVVGPCEITFEGMPINPAEHPVSILNGANWIGFPLNSSITLSNAFADFAANGDRIKSQTNNALYNGIRWQGQLNTLVPGSGYIYISNSEEGRTFIFPISTR